MGQIPVRNPYLLQAKLLIAEDRCINLLLEACRMDLLEYVQSHSGGIGEPLARRWSRQLCHAIAHLHEIGVMHLDVKLENIMLYDPTNVLALEACDIRLADFGLSALGKPGKWLTNMCGSGIYRAPEISLTESLGPYDGRAADVWSLGVSMFVLVRGCFPFAAEAPIGLVKQLVDASPRDVFGAGEPPLVLSSPIQRHRLPQDLLESLDSMLSLDPDRRPPVSALLHSDWLKCGADFCEAIMSDDGVSNDPGSDSGYATPPESKRPPRCPPYLIDLRRKRRRKVLEQTTGRAGAE